MTVTLAGHPPPVLIDAHGDARQIGQPGTLLGVLDPIHVVEHEEELRAGETLLLYTDGIPEAGHSGEALGERGLIELCRKAPRLTLASCSSTSSTWRWSTPRARCATISRCSACVCAPARCDSMSTCDRGGAAHHRGQAGAGQDRADAPWRTRPARRAAAAERDRKRHGRCRRCSRARSRRRPLHRLRRSASRPRRTRAHGGAWPAGWRSPPARRRFSGCSASPA